MKLSVEILDHVFSFLVSHQEFLFACLQDPALSSVAEKHFYSNLTVYFGTGGQSEANHVFKPDQISRLVAENHPIRYYVRVLKLRCNTYYQSGTSKRIDEFASTLLMFPALECIIFNGGDADDWSRSFRAALEDRLCLPTLKEVQVILHKSFPLSLFDGKNIKNLLISEHTTVRDPRTRVSTLPQLKSLSLSTDTILDRLIAWLKLHSNELQSLKCAALHVDALSSELLPMCSGTLKNLDINLENSIYIRNYMSKGQIVGDDWPGISCVPPNLDRLTIRTAVHLHQEFNEKRYISWLPAAAGIIKSFFSPLRHLVLDIVIILTTLNDFNKIDFSPLAILGLASRSIPRIDLYIHTGKFSSAVMRALLLSVLDDYEDIMKSIKEGVLVIHSEKSAPDDY